MSYIYIGRIVNTHGIKGELRIKSNFEHKEKVFVPGMKLYIGKEYYQEEIVTYRHHKEFDMVTFKNYDNINEVLKYLKKDVYVRRDDLNLQDNEYLLEELVDMSIIYHEEEYGKVTEIVYNNSNVLLAINGSKNFYIPNNPHFIKKVDINNNQIIVDDIEGLML